MAKEANPWAGVNVVGWKYSYFLKILAAKLAAERGVFLQFDEVAVGVADPGLFGIVVASLAASDGYAALFKKRHVVVQSLDLQAEMVEAGQPGVAGVFEGFKGLGRFRRRRNSSRWACHLCVGNGISRSRPIGRDRTRPYLPAGLF